MKHPNIGLLGLGSRSTLFYLEMLNKIYHLKLGDYHTFPCYVLNSDFNSINIHLPNNYNALKPTLQFYLDALFKTPIIAGVLPNITLHEAFDKFQFKHNIIHPLALLKRHLLEHKITRITVFGSKHTMTSNYISSYLKGLKIELILPEENAIIFLDKLRQNVYYNRETTKDLAVFKTLVNCYTKDNIVVIACTELSVLYPNIEDKQKVKDLALMQIEEMVTQSLKI